MIIRGGHMQGERELNAKVLIEVSIPSWWDLRHKHKNCLSIFKIKTDTLKAFRFGIVREICDLGLISIGKSQTTSRSPEFGLDKCDPATGSSKRVPEAKYSLKIYKKSIPSFNTTSQASRASIRRKKSSSITFQASLADLLRERETNAKASCEFPFV